MGEGDRSEPDPELARLVSALPTSIPPPEALERRTIRALRTQRTVPRPVLAVAAAVLFAFGLAAGRLLPVRATPDTNAREYLLLLYEDGDYRPASAGDASARVEEYRAWAREIARRGVTIGGERLDHDGVELELRDGVVGRGATISSDQLGGYFVIAAASRAEAERIAMTCPHLRYGGRVVVQTILPT
jgi:hypothetical protein